MSDIIERLRAAVPTYEGTPIAWPCEVRSELLLEAAARIDQLTSERNYARHLLRIFAHAHANGNAIPWSIERQTRAVLEAKP